MKLLIKPFVCLCIQFLLCANVLYGACQEDDYTVLRKLYLTTSGNNWTNTSGWPNGSFFVANPTLPAGTDMSTWHGVTLNANGCVSELSLFNNNLSGTIPAELGNLSALTHLILSINNLSGPIPPELGNLNNLTNLVLANNNLSGSIPYQLGSLPSLIEMIIHDNNLSGCYPPELNNLCSQLTSLNNNAHISDFNNFDATWEDFCNSGAGECRPPCQQNDYSVLRTLYVYTNGDDWTDNSGWPDADFFFANPTIPVDIDMSTWYGVTVDGNGCVICIDLDGNPTCSPTNFGGSGNNLTGTIPFDLSALSNIKFLSLARNQLGGSISRFLGDLNDLEVLYLYSNNLTGSIPPELGNLSNLEYLAVSNNQLTGAIPAELANLTNLTHLTLSGNDLTGSIPAEFGNMANLYELVIHDNQLSGCYEENLSTLCSQLNPALNNNFHISDFNNFDASWEDFCTSGIGECVPQPACQQDDYAGLRELYLTTTGDNWTNNTGWPDASFFIANPIIPSGIDMNSWYGVSLNANGCVTCVDLDGGDNCDPTNYSGSGNNLIGYIPASLANLTELSFLSVARNQLAGAIQTQLANLTNLEVLYLYSNNFIGSIPLQFGNLSNLEYLAVSNNQLSGAIPAELANLTNLTHLSLSGNDLIGSIPEEFGDMTNLYELVIHDNQLSGCYSSNLNNLCSQLNPALNNNFHISDFNNFDASWEDFCASGAGSCSAITENLIAHWPMDESAGPVINEVVASYNGTPTANIGYAHEQGKIAGALQFNGTDTRVECPSINIAGTEMTITFWMKAFDFINDDARIVSKATSIVSSNHYWMVSQIDGSGLRYRLQTSSGGTTVLATPAGMIPQNEWIFVTARYDGQTMKIYKNAVEIASTAKTGMISQGDVPVCIGNQPSGAGDKPFSGQIDDLRLFDASLSNAEIEEIYNDVCAQYMVIADLTLQEDMSFMATEEIVLRNVTVPEANSISLTSKNIIIGMDCNLNGESNLIVRDDLNCE